MITNALETALYVQIGKAEEKKCRTHDRYFSHCISVIILNRNSQILFDAFKFGGNEWKRNTKKQQQLEKQNHISNSEHECANGILPSTGSSWIVFVSIYSL